MRSFGKKIILNHEPFIGGELLEDYLKNFKHRFIIFNIKEAGIEKKVIGLAEKYGVKDYFLLDVEFPFMYLATRKEKFRKMAVRFSEAEPVEYALMQKGYLDWVWIDTITKLPLNLKIYSKIKSASFKTCLVCPERWGREEDILNYKKYFKDNKIKIDAVMTSLKNAPFWENE